MGLRPFSTAKVILFSDFRSDLSMHGNDNSLVVLMEDKLFMGKVTE